MLKINVEHGTDYFGNCYEGVVKYQVCFEHCSNWKLNKTIAHSPFGVPSAEIAMVDIKKKLVNRLEVIQRNADRLREEIDALNQETKEIHEWLRVTREA